MVIIALAVIAFLFLKIRDRNIRRLHSLEREKIKFQFETLKSQVNPHFLFNSFNTLISIIEKDKNTAVEYVENLSEYFRNLIYYRDKDVISLEEELKLSAAYYFLQQKRFGNSLCLKIEIDKSKNQWMVPPLVVQILIENAIKHNAVSKETPLIINITTEKDKLIIKNNINHKYSAEKSTGTGIQNVMSRYELLTNVKVEVLKTETEFMVAIPLIKTT
jgi:LytS/YehU family sensor histidine kinase